MSGNLSGYDAFPDFTAGEEDDIQIAGNFFDLPTDYLANDLATESSFNPSAVNSTSGASGIAQFIPSTASMMDVDPMDSTASTYAGAEYLSNLGAFSNPSGALQSYGTSLPAYEANAAEYDPSASVQTDAATPATGGRFNPSNFLNDVNGTPANSAPGGGIVGAVENSSAGGVLTSIENFFSDIGNITEWVGEHPVSALVLTVAIIGLIALLVGYAIKSAGVPTKWMPH